MIERQAAIDALIAEGRNVDSRYLESERIIHESDAVEVIAMLPSEQPEDEDCDTCKHGDFYSIQCDNCRVVYPSYYERRDDV